MDYTMRTKGESSILDFRRSDRKCYYLHLCIILLMRISRIADGMLESTIIGNCLGAVY